jgi:hypothetical protein
MFFLFSGSEQMIITLKLKLIYKMKSFEFLELIFNESII